MKKNLIIFALVLLSTSLFAQKFITKNGHIQFYSETPMETIEADNHSVNAAYDHESGMFVFKVLMKSFEFEKALMQEHFNENYVESDQFPNATFKGEIVNNDDIDLTKKGEVAVNVKGQITIHGMTMDLETAGTMNLQDDMIEAKATFMVDPLEFDIKIPGAVVKNIAEEIEVRVDVKLKKL
jgi:polyisoprenoid-binding protein YceI